MSAETTFDAVIIGAGAAGLMCGGTAGQRGRKVLLLERSPNVGQKIFDFRRGALQLHQSPGRT